MMPKLEKKAFSFGPFQDNIIKNLMVLFIYTHRTTTIKLTAYAPRVNFHMYDSKGEMQLFYLIAYQKVIMYMHVQCIVPDERKCRIHVQFQWYALESVLCLLN